MRSFLILVAIVAVTMFSCKSRQAQFATQNKGAFLDTLLVVDSLNFLQKGIFNGLFNGVAETAIEEYFDKLGYYQTKDSASVDWENDILLCAGFDTIYRTHLNTDKFIDGLVTYYDAPCMANGHCYQPHLAIMTFINGKYRLISRDLLPENYSIDSITQDKKFTYIHGNVYNCGEHEYMRGYRARIRR
jgi:hypothetical protein